MFTRKRVLWGLAVVLLAGGIGGPTGASKPTSGAISYAHPVLSWESSMSLQGGSPLVATLCTMPNSCDDFTLTVNRGTVANSLLTLDLTSGGTLTAYDVLIYAPGCKTDATPSCYGDNQTDHIELAEPKNGT